MTEQEHWEDQRYPDSPDLTFGIKTARRLGLRWYPHNGYGDRDAYEVATGQSYKWCEVADEIIDELRLVVLGRRYEDMEDRAAYEPRLAPLGAIVSIERCAGGFVVRYPGHNTEHREAHVFGHDGSDHAEAEALLSAVLQVYPDVDVRSLIEPDRIPRSPANPRLPYKQEKKLKKGFQS